jgi:hypothetical protein
MRILGWAADIGDNQYGKFEEFSDSHDLNEAILKMVGQFGDALIELNAKEAQNFHLFIKEYNDEEWKAKQLAAMAYLAQQEEEESEEIKSPIPVTE